MFRRIASCSLSFIMILTFVFSLGVPASAAVTPVKGTEYGSMQDTSDPSNGVIQWSFTYDRTLGTASLSLWGEGYMPNDTDDSWFDVQNRVQCYVSKVTIGEGIKSIMNNAFAYEEYLKEVTLPSTLEIIGEAAFAYTAITKINIPAKVSKLSAKMFVKSPIEAFTVDAGNPYFTAKDGDIYSKDMKTFVVAAPGKFQKTGGKGFNFPESVSVIAPEAFYMCDIREVTIPSNITEIQNMAFAGSSIETLRIDSGLQKIYDSAFLACDSLKEAALPATINYLGYYSLGFVYMLDTESIEMILDDLGISHGVVNESNCMNYLSQTDYTVDSFMYCAPNPAFTLYAATGSVGASYANMSEVDLKITECSYSRAYSATPTETGILIKWIASADATGYKIMRKNLFDDWVNIGVVYGKDTLFFTDKAPLEDITNEYTVIAFNNKGDALFDDSGVKCDYVKIPVLKSAELKNAAITVSWNSVATADNYIVYKKIQGETDWLPFVTINGAYSSCTDTDIKPGKTYAYTVAAVKGNTKGLFNSTGVKATYLGTSKLTAYNINSGMALKWTFNGVADSFKIYRKTENSGWSHIYTAKGSDRVYVDKTITHNVKYTYKLEPVYKGAADSDTSIQSTYLAIKSPMSFTVQNTVNGVYVKWSKCSGASRYFIYRKKSGAKHWTRIAIVNGNSTVTYLDKTAKSGETYIYTVRAYNGSYKSSFRANGKKTVFLSTPKKNGIVSTKAGVQVKYTRSTGATGYYIYRKEGKSPWKRVGIVKNNKTLYYIDKTAEKGKTYTYTVRAYKSNYRSSFYASGQRIKDRY